MRAALSELSGHYKKNLQKRAQEAWRGMCWEGTRRGLVEASGSVHDQGTLHTCTKVAKKKKSKKKWEGLVRCLGGEIIGLTNIRVKCYFCSSYKGGRGN